MSIPSSAIVGPIADARLAQLGLTADILRDAVQVGYSHAAGCTEHDPKSLGGILAWGKGLGHLRDRLKPDGWHADRGGNFETVVHPSNSHRVTLSSGNADTGREDATPRTRTPRGPETGRAVRRNAQLTLGQGTNVFALTGALLGDDDDRETWLLLHHLDRDADEIRIELSCPMEMTGSQITRWRQRIILQAVPFTADVDIVIEPDHVAPIDIVVSRKND